MTASHTEHEPLAPTGIQRGPADALLTPVPLNSALLAGG